MGYYSTIEGTFKVSTADGSPVNPFNFVLAVKAAGEIEYLIYDTERCVPHNNVRDELSFPVSGDGKYYYLLKDVNEFAAALEQRNIVLNGYLYRVGEVQPDIQKIIIDNNVVKVYRGYIAFEDGTTWER